VFTMMTVVRDQMICFLLLGGRLVTQCSGISLVQTSLPLLMYVPPQVVPASWKTLQSQ